MIPGTYHKFIDWIGDGTGLPDTILHIHAGLAVLMVGRILTRRSLGSFVPWSLVVIAEAMNEIMDRLQFGSWRWEDTTSDILNTLFWPTVICLGVRMRPMLLPRDNARVTIRPRADGTADHRDPGSATVIDRPTDTSGAPADRPPLA